MASAPTGFRERVTFWWETSDLLSPSTVRLSSPRAKERPSANLSNFAELRRENIGTLTGLNLTAIDLERIGQHPELGEVTLSQLLATWVVHDLDHIAQIARTMAKAYGKAAGPWTGYLSILTDRI